MADSRSGHPHPAGPYFTVDLHLHTNRGSSDSNLAPKDLVDRARVIGIGAVCVTEHDNMWDSREIDLEGGILIANHPFRYKLDPRFSFINPDSEPIDPTYPDRAAKLRIFELVDAIEVL